LVDGLTNFVEGSLSEWGRSDFLDVLDLGPQQAQFNQLEQQMTQLSGQIATAIQQQQQSLLLLQQIQSWLNAASLQAASLSLGRMEDLQDTQYQNFTSVMQDGSGGGWYSWGELGSSTALQQDLATALGCQTVDGFLSCTGYTDPLYTDSLNIVGSGAPAPGSGMAITDAAFASTLFKAIQAVAMADPPTAGTPSTSNLPAMAETNDETIMAYVSQIAVLLQQDYNILATLLALKYCTSEYGGCAPTGVQWSKLSLPYTGFNDSNTAQVNAANLNATYTGFFKTLVDVADQYLISDPVFPGQSAAPYTQLDTMPGVYAGSWTHACNLFVWSGASPTAGVGFTGFYNGQTLTPECWTTVGGEYQPVPTQSVDPSAICSDAQSQLSAAFAPTASGQAAQLACQSGIRNEPYWGYPRNETVGGSVSYTISGSDPHGTYYFDLPSDTTQFAGSSDGSKKGWSGVDKGQAYVNTAWTLQSDTSVGQVGAFSVPYQWDAPNGYVGPFAVVGTGGGDFEVSWTFQLACLSGDSFCGGGVADGICLAGYPVTLTGVNSNTATIAVDTSDRCAVPGATPSSGTVPMTVAGAHQKHGRSRSARAT
jgi:hypothetical protein